MIANRLFSNCSNVIRRNALALRKSGVPVREGHVVAIPPRNRAPAAEMIAMGVILAVSFLATPAWVLYHLPDYQREDRNKYTGK